MKKGDLYKWMSAAYPGDWYIVELYNPPKGRVIESHHRIVKIGKPVQVSNEKGWSEVNKSNSFQRLYNKLNG